MAGRQQESKEKATLNLVTKLDCTEKEHRALCYMQQNEYEEENILQRGPEGITILITVYYCLDERLQNFTK